MSEQFNHNLNPDDFWPDAEKMLNKHFRTKMIIRRVIYSSLIIAFFSGVTVWTLHNKNSATEHSAHEPAPNEQTSLSTSGNNITSKSILTENTSSSTLSKDEGSTTSNTVSNNDNQPNENKNKQTDIQKSATAVNTAPTNNTSTTRDLKENSEITAVATNASNTKHKNHFKNGTSSSALETTIIHTDASAKNKSKHSSRKSNSSVAENASDATINGSRGTDKSARKQKHIKNTSVESTDINTSPLANSNWKSMAKKKSNVISEDENYNQSNSLVKDKPTIIEPELLAYLPLAKANLSEAVELFPILNSGITPSAPHKVIATSWAVNAYGLLSQNYHTISSAPFNAYAARRNNEEKNILTHGIGLSLSFLVNKWKFSAGFEYTSTGEKTTYSSSLYKDVITQNGRWDTATVPYTITNSAYVNGMQFYIYGSNIYFTNPIYVLDSTYSQTADTTSQKVFVLIPSQTNQFHYLQLPLEVSYMIRNNKLGVGIAAGISPGLLISQKGSVLKTDESGLINLSDPKDYKTFMLNGMIGLDFSYAVDTHWSILLSPQYRTNLQSIYKSDAIHQKYSSATLKVGISYRLK